jgi:hypothetical protein
VERQSKNLETLNIPELSPRRTEYMENLQQGQSSRTKPKEEKNYIWRADSKDKVPGQSPRRTKYMECLQQTKGSCIKSKEDRIYGCLKARTRLMSKVQERQNIRRINSRVKVPEESPRRTEYYEGFQQGHGSLTKSIEDSI